ncbi:DUF4190 domain-containing protein [Mycobacterium sp. D16R24]|uniref:DUF4190 domain-containing protein n=1 Tax=Mycobacterium sp. D16R24 TaxID=1855656 RepID=UPI0011164620|nr:DUF4190 domain-containing protein [Mycobacterium sp. D16R24]
MTESSDKPGAFPRRLEEPPHYPGATPQEISLKNGLGVASLIIAATALASALSVFVSTTVWWVSGGEILRIVARCSVFGGVILGIVAVVIGFAASGRVKRGEANNGRFAIMGIVLGCVAIFLLLAFIAWETVGTASFDHVRLTRSALPTTTAAVAIQGTSPR